VEDCVRSFEAEASGAQLAQPLVESPGLSKGRPVGRLPEDRHLTLFPLLFVPPRHMRAQKAEMFHNPPGKSASDLAAVAAPDFSFVPVQREPAVGQAGLHDVMGSLRLARRHNHHNVIEVRKHLGRSVKHPQPLGDFV
jgi:hypothetical protein